MPRLTISPDDFKRAKIVKPGWYPTFLKSITEELNSKKDAMNIVIDAENADKDSEFMGVPVKHWISEKMPSMGVALAKAFNPTINEKQLQEVEFGEYMGRYVYAKWKTDRGADGQQPARNAIEDWAPLPKKWDHLNNIRKDEVSGSVDGFEKI